MEDDALEELARLLTELRTSTGGGSQATSVRLPVALHRAVHLATQLGMDESFTAATSRALLDRLATFARERALAAHFAAFPADRPSLAAVVHRRVRGTDHAATRHPELVDDAAAWVERTHPDWSRTGVVDATVDRVLDHLEMLEHHRDLPRRAIA